MQISDETLMALADDELDAETARQLNEAIAADPDLAARHRRFVLTRQALAATRAARPGKAHDSDPLAAMIRAGITPAAPARRAANLNRRPVLAAAASLAIAAIGLGWWSWSTDVPSGLSVPEIAALDSLPSGESQALGDGGTLTMIASFQAAEAGLCREYETAQDSRIRTVLACRDGGGWQERFAVTAETADETAGGYQPASGEGSVDAALERIGAGAPLSPADEAAALGINPPG